MRARLSFSTMIPGRGAVLLLVLGAIAILAILAIEVVRRAHGETLRAGKAAGEAAFRRGFDSGIQLAKGLLVEGRHTEGFDHPGDPWGKGGRLELEDGTEVLVRLEDESGKLNLRTLGRGSEGKERARKTLHRLFEFLRQTHPQPNKSWETIENKLCQRLGLPCMEEEDPQKKQSPKPKAPTAGPLSTAPSPERLMTLDGLREDGLDRKTIFGLWTSKPGEDRMALARLFTLFGDGRINLNTAHPAVLFGLDPSFDRTQVEQILGWRGEEDGEKGGGGKPFRRPQDLELVPGIVQRAMMDNLPRVILNKFHLVQDRIGVKSSCFSARIVVNRRDGSREGWAFFQVAQGTASLKVNFEAAKVVLFEEVEP